LANFKIARSYTLTDQSGLKLIDIDKSFGDTLAVNKVSFDVVEGEIVALLGPSGSGKSTVLMVISGLEKPDQGDVLWNGTSILHKPPHRRGFGLMFQDFALFPHMNVYDNIAFGLKMSSQNRARGKKQVDEMLALVGLTGFGERNVHTLSGGEQQRVALARALAPSPKLLMLDEPLGSVDRALRERLMVEVRQILHQMGQTALYVTHDQEEAFTIADRVVVMRSGEIEQSGTPQAIYNQPVSLFMARFLGFTNLLTAEVMDLEGRQIMRTPLGDLPANDLDRGTFTMLLRPDAVHLNDQESYKLEGEVLESTFRGNTTRIMVSVNNVRLQFDLPSQAKLPKVGEHVVLSFDLSEAVHVYPDDEN
jgi:ABC-type Fe3+/spermidine/putrescine transport system ATPase subunit